MKRLLIVFALIVAGVVGLSFYLDWFHIGSDKSDGKDHLTLTVDEEKIKEDEKKAQEKVHNLGQPDKDKSGAPPEQSKEPAVAPAKQPPE